MIFILLVATTLGSRLSMSLMFVGNFSRPHFLTDCIFLMPKVYSNGLSEVILGKAIKKFEFPREEIVVMTKVHVAPPFV